MLRRNVIANTFGQVWPVVLALATVPVYVRSLGTEGYGLVGFLTALAAVVAVLDLGLSSTSTREIARRATGEAAPSIRSLVHTLELWYFALAACTALILLLAAPALASTFVDASGISQGDVVTSLRLASLFVALRVPIGLYAGVLRGLERQVALNIASSLTSSLRNAGGAVVALATGDVVACFAWFAGASVLDVAVLAVISWRSMPPADRVGIARADVRNLRRFSRGVAAISLLAVALKQIDRFVVASVLPLESLGYYTAAATAAAALTIVPTAVFAAVLPRMSALFAVGDDEALAGVYRDATRVVALTVAPLAAGLAAFGHEALATWTRSTDVAHGASRTLAILAVAFGLNSVMQLPWALQLASGDVRLQLWTNGLSVVALAPATWLSVHVWGLAGAGAAWLVFNIVYVSTVPPLLHTRLLRSPLRQWYLRDVLPFAAAAAVCFGTAWLVLRVWDADRLTAGAIGGTVAAGAAYALVAWRGIPGARADVLRFLRGVG